MSKDLYLLVDGTHADPDECDVGADNELRHIANGVPVALRENGAPQTVALGAVENMNAAAAQHVDPDEPPPADVLATEEPEAVEPAKSKAKKPKKYKNRELRTR